MLLRAADTVRQQRCEMSARALRGPQYAQARAMARDSDANVCAM